MQKWSELKTWLCNKVLRKDGGYDEDCESIRISAVVAKMLDLERLESRLRRQEFNEPFDGEH